jgi:hypothetical protein
MKTTECEEVFYPGSTYVWCKGVSSKLGRHPIFVSSPVRFTPVPSGRSTMLTCREASCSLCGAPTTYQEKEIGFQDQNVLRTWHTRSNNNERKGELP